MKRLLNNPNGSSRILGLVCLAAITASVLAFADKSKSANPPADLKVDARPPTRHNGNSFAPIVKKVSPAVVQVYTATQSHPASLQGPEDDLFRRFFGQPWGGRMPRQQGALPRQHGIGSGVIVTRDGYILTNSHVVENADEVKVALADGTEHTARVVGRDPKTDIAVLKINARDLSTVSMADSDNVEVGDMVLALGNPFGIGQTVTTGIVSATGRSGATGLDYEDFIQTDAAINPGNSGGALVDAEGRLIGINTAILSRTGGNQGIGFAIPANMARNVMESIIEHGKVTRGFLGVLIQDITPSLAKEFNLKDSKGALVGDVTPRSPAEKAGLKNGDIITTFNGKPVADSRRLRLDVARVRPGETVTVEVLRDGKPRTMQVAVKELPGSETLASHTPAEREDTGTLNGVGVTDLDPQTRRQLRLSPGLGGALITEVDPGCAAAEAGLRPGDLITEINRKPVKSADEAVRLTEAPDSKRTLLRVLRDGRSWYVVVDETDAG